MISVFLVVQNKSDALTTEGKLSYLLNELYANDIGVTVVICSQEPMSFSILGSCDVFQESDISYEDILEKYRDLVFDSDYIAFIEEEYLVHQIIHFDESALVLNDNCVIFKTEDFHIEPTLMESISKCSSVRLFSCDKFKLFCDILLTK